MSDPLQLVIECDKHEDIIRTMNAVMPLLPKDIRRELGMLNLNYAMKYGVPKLYEIANRHTVSEIIDSLRKVIVLNTIVSGERDGLKYVVTDAESKSMDES